METWHNNVSNAASAAVFTASNLTAGITSPLVGDVHKETDR